MAYQVKDYEGFDLKDHLVDSLGAKFLVQELICLTDMADGFASAMKAKIFKHFCLGKHGWESLVSNEDLVAGVKAAMEDEDWISVANFAMFLWNRQHME